MESVGAFEGKHVRRINRAKRKHREDLDDWQEQNYFATWHKIIKPQLLAQLPHKRAEVIPRITSKQYAASHRVKQSPCIITDCTETWPAKRRWTFQQFLCDRKRRKEKLKCGEDDEGYSLKVTLDTFLRYQNAQRDDSPLYVFDSHNKFICEDYSVPEIFAQDLFQHVGERKRPPYRWFLIGPERSGSTIHIDPLQTSAWNASLRGRKLWAVFSPEVDRQIVKGRKYKKKDDEAIDWFVQMMPHILENDLPATAKFYYFVQKEGETVFVPSGWWHVVLNLDDTIAITQNFACDENFDLVWRSTRVERKKLAKKWRRKLRESHPQSYARLMELDEKDGYDLDKEIEEAKQKKETRKRHKHE